MKQLRTNRYSIVFLLQSIVPYQQKSLLLISLFFCFSFSVLAANNNENKTNETVNQTPSDNPTPEIPTMPWSLDLQELSNSNSADEVIWLDVKDEKLLLLKYWAKGNKKRGNIILLPAEGENADHPRLIKPLTLQLSQLGWQVYIPTLPIEDYPVKITKASTNQVDKQKNVTTNPESEPNQEKLPVVEPISEIKVFFPSEKEYQIFINLVLQKVISQIQPKTATTLIIGNQNMAYWMLQETKQNSQITQVVLLDPQLPENIESNLKTTFEGQTLPAYTFIDNEHRSKSFSRAFENNYWTSIYHRFDRRSNDNSYLNIENIRLAKRITGWAESINKTSL